VPLVGDARVQGPAVERGEEILTPEAPAFVADLQTRFGAHRDAILAARAARRAEITGPTGPRMAINALDSGANVWPADLEDADTPHRRNPDLLALTAYDPID
jgi:malate synthase